MTKEKAKIKVYDLSQIIAQAQAQIAELNQFIVTPEQKDEPDNEPKKASEGDKPS